MSKKRAVIYARFSSHNQTEQSIEGQLRECYAYAKRNRLIILNEYIDRALSGTTDNRPQFKQMIEDSKKGDFDFVLVYQLDRFARNRYDSATYKAKLKKNGVRVLSAKENISDDASGVLMESVLEGMAEYYSAELSQKVKRGIKESLIKGNYIGGYILYGFDVVNKKYVINEVESEIVRKIFRDYANGKKAIEIVNELNNKGLKTKYGNKFTLNIIAKMIRNEKYIGICKMDDEIYTNIFPPIIEESVFKRCNLIMDNHKHRQRKDSLNEDVYILSGKLFCGYCGYPMVAETGTSKTGAVHRYYKCSGKKKKITKCDKHNVRKDTIEDFVFEKTKKYVLEPSIIDSIAEVVVNRFNSELSNNAVLTKLQEELKEKNRAIDSILNAMEKGIITNSTQERLMKLENEKAILEDKVEYEQNHQIKPLEKEQIVNFLKVYARKQFDNKTDKNEFFNNFILKVLLYDDKITIVYNTSLNPAEEIYNHPNDNNDDNNSDNGTTIYKKEIEISGDENKKLPFEFKRQLFGGSSNSQFEPVLKNSNQRGFLQSAEPYGSKSQFENGANAPEFEPFDKITNANTEKGEFETKNDETATANENVETQNKKKGRPKAKNKTTQPTIQKFSNHIKFIDYISTHEIITYRHLFAYGFYVE